MTQEQLIVQLNVLLDSYEARITEAERWKRDGIAGVHPAFFSGQLYVLTTVCTELEALVLEAASHPLPPAHSALMGVAEHHESVPGRPPQP